MTIEPRFLPIGLICAVLCLLPAQSRAAVTFQESPATPGGAILELLVDQPLTMTVTPFRLKISDTAGKPLRGAKVSCELTMPSMPMPENRPVVKEAEGYYGGELIFTCPMGAWRFTCQARGEDGSSRTMNFDIPPVRMK